MLYKIKWEILSAIETELQSDTIFGHICWALAYSNGEKALIDFLEALREPIFKLSSGFPEGRLPAPKLKGSIRVYAPELATELKRRELDKKAAKRHYLPVELWHKHLNAFEYDHVHEAATEIDRYFETVLQEHNSINRHSGTTRKGEANLYSEVVHYPVEDITAFDSYLATDYFSKGELEALFAFIADSGFGRNKHTGRGKFKITLAEYAFPKVESPNSWLLLSNAVPAPDDPIALGYEGFVKHGKLGGSYATGGKSPFKKPVFLIKPGAVFFGDAAPKGSLVQGIHPDDPAICQNAYALCMGFHLKGV
jgi:CRISPR-associated protein Csm4